MVGGDRAAFVLAITLDGPAPLTFLCVATIRVDEDGLIAEFTAYPDLEAVVEPH